MHQIITVDNDKFGKLRTIRQGDKMLFCATDVAKALGYIDPHKAIKLHCKSDGWANYPVIDNMGREQKAKFITEGNVYRLICHSKLPSAEQFEKWVFDEVLPQIRKTGKYETLQAEQLTLETEEYHYYDKTYCGEPVLTLKDIEYFTGINFDISSAYFNRHGVRGEDFAVLSGDSLRALKSENPSMPRGLRWLTVVTKSGFVKLMEFYGCKADTPKCFIADNKPVTAEKPKQAAAVHEFSKPTIDELVIALNVIQYARHNSEKCEKIANMSSMGEHYAKEQAGLDTARKYIGMMLTL